VIADAAERLVRDPECPDEWMELALAVSASTGPIEIRVLAARLVALRWCAESTAGCGNAGCRSIQNAWSPGSPKSPAEPSR